MVRKLFAAAVAAAVGVAALARPGDVEDSHGRAMVFEALDNGFVLGLEDDGGDASIRPRTHFAVTDDFLLDPNFSRIDGPAGGTPVQVLD